MYFYTIDQKNYLVTFVRLVILSSIGHWQGCSKSKNLPGFYFLFFLQLRISMTLYFQTSLNLVLCEVKYLWECCKILSSFIYGTSCNLIKLRKGYLYQ